LLTSFEALTRFSHASVFHPSARRELLFRLLQMRGEFDFVGEGDFEKRVFLEKREEAFRHLLEHRESLVQKRQFGRHDLLALFPRLRRVPPEIVQQQIERKRAGGAAFRIPRKIP